MLKGRCLTAPASSSRPLRHSGTCTLAAPHCNSRAFPLARTNARTLAPLRFTWPDSALAPCSVSRMLFCRQHRERHGRGGPARPQVAFSTLRAPQPPPFVSPAREFKSYFHPVCHFSRRSGGPQHAKSTLGAPLAPPSLYRLEKATEISSNGMGARRQADNPHI